MITERQAIRIRTVFAGKIPEKQITPEEREQLEDILHEITELNVAKTPDLEGDGYSDGHLVYDTWICPHCEKKYEMKYEEHDHCPNCGQAIDWTQIKGGQADE